ncbi:MAG: SdrD B-like domain-containing protein [Sulfitobacter sp.]
MFTVNVDPNAANAPATLQNTATATGTAPDGTVATDLSDTDTAPDGAADGTTNVAGGAGDPTVITPPANEPELDVAKSASVGTLQADGTVDVTYTVEIENTGNVTLSPLTLVDDLTAADQLGTAFNGIVTAPAAPSLTNTSGTSTAPSQNAAYDGTDGLLSGTDGSLAPGDSVSVVFTVNVDPNAADAPATLQNTATAAGTAPDGTVATDLSDTDTAPDGTADGTTNVAGGNGDPTVITPPAEVGEIGLVKTAVLNDDDEIAGISAGDTIDYTYVATNNSTTVNLYNVTVDEPNTQDNAFSGSGTVPTPVHEAGTGFDLDAGEGTPTDIAPGESVTFTASYTITQSDIDAGGVENSAVVSAENPSGALVTDSSDESDPAIENDDPTFVPLEAEPSISLVKSITGLSDSNGSGLLDAGDTVTFTFAAQNTGNTALADVAVTDAGLAPITLVQSGGFDGDLAVMEGPVVIATAAYVLTDADINAGGIENSATVDATPVATNPDGTPDPLIPLRDSTGALLDPVDDVSDAGTQPEIDPATGLPVLVDAAETVETPDLANGTDGDLTNDPTALLVPAPSVAVVKSVSAVIDTNGNGFTDAGDEVQFTFSVENTGNTALTDIVVDDPLPGLTITGSPIASLAVGSTPNTTVRGSYLLTQDDVAQGGIENSATVQATAVDAAGVPIADPFGGGQAVTVADVSDAGTAPDGDTVIAPQDAETAALDGSTDADATNDPTVFLITPQPAIEVVKSLADVVDTNGNGLVDAGDRVDYSFVVTNTGNVDLSGVSIADDLVAVSGGPIVLEIGATDTSSFTAQYIITAQDVEAGGVENTATASGTATDASGAPITDPITGVALTAEDDSDSGSTPDLDANGNPVTQNNAATTETPALDGSTDADPANDPTVLFIATPSVSIVKSLANAMDDNIPGGDGLFGGEGDTLVYRFTVTNTGNTSLSGVTVTDPTATVSGGPIDLAVGAGDSVSFTATYIVTSADIDTGFVENSATVTGAAVNDAGTPIFGPDGGALSVSDVSDTGTNPDASTVTDPEAVESEGPEGATVADNDPTNDPTVSFVPSNALPQISVIKSVASVADSSGDGLVGEGDTVTYRFTVANTGNVALADVTITDDIATVSGGPITLAIGATDSTSFTATAVITAAQAAAGAIENTAQATGNGVNSAGDPIRDQNGTPLVAADTSDAGTQPEVPQSGVPTAINDPEGNETADANGATDGDPANDPTVLFLPMPEMQLVKSVASVMDTNGSGVTDAGDTLTYAFTVTNTGNADLIDITVTDSLAGVTVSGNPIASLAQGEVNSGQITATYTLLQADIVAGGVENTASASGTAVGSDGAPLGDPLNPNQPLGVTDVSDAGTAPDGTVVADPEGSETPDLGNQTDAIAGNDPTVFIVPAAPSIELIKSVSGFNDLDGDGLPGLNDEVIYSFVVRNTGNVALGSVEVFDPLGTVAGGPISLAIGASNSTEFTLTYAITQSDVTQGGVENTATAQGTAVDTAGNPVADPNTGGPQLATDISDTGSESELGANGVPDLLADPANTESADLGGGTDQDPTNDPTVIVLPTPELTLVKSTSNVFDTNEDGLFGGEGDEVTYQFTVTNTGNIALSGVTLSDDTAEVSGGPVDLAVGQGDSVTFTARYVVTAEDIARGFVENTAVATGNGVSADGAPLVDLNGAPIVVSDRSDTGTNPDVSTVDDPAATETPDGEGNTDTDPGNDPTVTSVPSNALPQLEVIKSIVSVTDDGDAMIGVGDTVLYSFAVTNTGNVALADVAIADDLVAVNGGPVSLALGETDTDSFTASYVLTQADIDAGGVQNTATATGGAVNAQGNPITAPGGGDQLLASDVSDSGTAGEVGEDGAITVIADPGGTETPDLLGQTDSDPTNDPTVLLIPSPSIDVQKSVASAPDSNGDGVFGGIGDTLFYSFVVTNTGNVALADVTLTDPTADVAGGPINLGIGDSDTTSFTATYIVTANDVNVIGFVENTATVSGTALGTDGAPLGDPANPGASIIVSDISDTGTDSSGETIDNPLATETANGAGATDGDATNDPTVFNVPATAEPEIELVKSVSSVFDTDNDAVLGGKDDEVLYSFDVTNTGDVTLLDVVVTDPLLGGVVGTIARLEPLASVTLTASYIITEEDQTAGFVENTATASGTAVNGDGTPLLDPETGAPLLATDVSDTGTDQSGELVEGASGTETPDFVGQTDSDPTNDPTVLAIPLSVPDTAVSGLVFFDSDQDGVFNNNDTLLAGFNVQLRDENGDIVAITTSDANGFYSLEGFAVGTLDIEFVDPESGEIIGTIEGLVFERNTVLSDQDQAVIGDPQVGQLVLTKSTPLATVVLGTSVPYTITVQNTSGLPVQANLVDRLPSGFLYTPDTGAIEGVAVEPLVQGRTLTWEDIEIPGATTITLQLIARVGPSAPTGELVNIVRASDPVTGEALATPATATVRRVPEAIFECSDVIGKVFDDRNFNGYQDDVRDNRSAAITDQSIFTGKYAGKGESLPTEDKRELGLSNIRISTPTGTIITTDEHGRFNVPCAELPDASGRNFTLKVDERSLPTGYRMTTENPRSLRLTAGIATEMNFGAALGRVLDVDLTAAAFNGEEPVKRLDDGLVSLLTKVAKTPSVIRISYFTNGEDKKLALRRVAKLEDLIAKRWKRIGHYRLIVETDIKRLQ